MRRLVLCMLTLLIVAGESAAAQAGPESPNDSLFRSARRMVADGNGAAGRMLVDSLLKRAVEGTQAYGDALYWRGALAGTAAEAERDYRRVIVEYPLSPYADDALLSLAELEQARGDRASALQRLQRFVREHPMSTARGTAALAAARLAFDLRDTRAACAMIGEARASSSAADVELRNQLEYFAGRCPTDPLPATATPAPAAPPPTVAAIPRVRDTTAIPRPTVVPVREAPTVSTPRPTPKRAGDYTIQIAAYSTLPDARRMVAKLAARKVTARVSGTTKPFRVRLGFYATRQAAAQEVVALKARGIIGFVTTEPAGPERVAP